MNPLVELIGGPVVGGLVAWFVGKASAAKEFQAEVEKLIAKFEVLKKGLELHTQTHQNTVEEKIDTFAEELDTLKELVDRMRDSSHDMAKHAELANFMSEVNKKWQEMSGLMGEIRGELRARRMKSNPP